jgi:hypothetical protein
MALKAPAFDIVVFDGTLSTTLLNPAATLTLPTYSDPIILRLEIHRTIQITSDKNGQYSTFTGPLDGHGIHIFGVYDQCFANVIFQWKDAANNAYQSGPGLCVAQPVADTTWSDTLLVKGSGQVFRQGAVPYDPGHCGAVPCHTYSGDQEVVATQLAVPLGLTVNSPYVGPPGSIATFTAVGVPNYLGARGYQVPVRVVSWVWGAAGGGTGQTVPCNAGINPCQTRVMEAGTMTVTAIVNGVQQTKSISMTVVPCPTGDSLIDDPLNRTMLTDEWNLSGPTAAIQDRRERSAAKFDSAGNIFYRLNDPDPTMSPCSNTGEPSMHIGDTALLESHAHPFSKGDTLPDNCKDPSSGPHHAYYGNSYGGLSGSDWRRMWEDQVPFLVPDQDSVYRIYPYPIDSTQQPSGNYSYFPKSGWKSVFKAVPRFNGFCRIM